MTLNTTVHLTQEEAEALRHAVLEDICFNARCVAEDGFDEDAVEDAYGEVQPLFSILEKMKVSLPDHFLGEDANTDRAYQQMKEKFGK
ncbi:hypothetical protein [Paracoccus litorisediminis]|uniref:Uncharacterized protein n=1 Tax=Paracoccus litorisediminis TaxID=2006130 RepID=A0A844HPX2_9RHOB|nr:hypothetical protein [Paracoccus litorisediminis]MTH61108.1 hypothetical protein [Paracoccus litorisediminis]